MTLLLPMRHCLQRTILLLSRCSGRIFTLSIMLNLRFRGQIKVCFRRRIWQVCLCAAIMAVMRFCAMCLRIMLLSLMSPLLPLRRRVRLPLRQADWELRLLRRWMVMLCRRRWCGGSLLMRSCILIRRCIGVRSIGYHWRRRYFWSFSELLTKHKKRPRSSERER